MTYDVSESLLQFFLALVEQFADRDSQKRYQSFDTK
jgi:hypothetical protein